jgi:hypothetical protein
MVQLSLCNQSSFCAENMLVTVIPSFNYDETIPLISCPHQTNLGPFRAGLPATVPLWIAKTLHQRKLAQIELPDWLDSEQKLVEILHEERESGLLTNKLPFYYYEIARSLDFCLPKQTQVVLQDVVSLRSDKLRQHFHELSKTELQVRPNYDEDYELPMFSVTGIASYELNKVGPFLQRAFSDYGFLSKRAVDEGMNKAGATASRNKAAAGEEDEDGLQKDQPASQESRKIAAGRSRLRRFRS